MWSQSEPIRSQMVRALPPMTYNRSRNRRGGRHQSIRNRWTAMSTTWSPVKSCHSLSSDEVTVDHLSDQTARDVGGALSRGAVEPWSRPSHHTRDRKSSLIFTTLIPKISSHCRIYIKTYSPYHIPHPSHTSLCSVHTSTPACGAGWVWQLVQVVLICVSARSAWVYLTTRHVGGTSTVITSLLPLPHFSHLESPHSLDRSWRCLRIITRLRTAY